MFLTDFAMMIHTFPRWSSRDFATISILATAASLLVALVGSEMPKNTIGPSSPENTGSLKSTSMTKFSLSPVNRSMVDLEKLDLLVFGDHFASSYLPSGNRFISGKTNHHMVTVKQQTDVPHALIATALAAWTQHYGLELGPDEIWTAVSFGVSQHLGANATVAELYRKKFVDHEGKKKLTVQVTPEAVSDPRSHTNKAQWTHAIENLAEQIMANTKTDLAEIITRPFSTTGKVEKTVFSAMLMETMKQYFSFGVPIICGIPEIVLHGTEQDYTELIARIDKLIEIFPDLSWWLTRIRGHVSKIRDSVRGEVDSDWWKRIVFENQIDNVCVIETRISGWIGDFIPYVCEEICDQYCSDSDTTCSEMVFTDCEEFCEKNEDDQRSLESFKKPAVTMTEAKLTTNDSPVGDLIIAAGFVGIHQNKVTRNLRPALGWLVFWKE